MTNQPDKQEDKIDALIDQIEATFIPQEEKKMILSALNAAKLSVLANQDENGEMRYCPRESVEAINHIMEYTRGRLKDFKGDFNLDSA